MEGWNDGSGVQTKTNTSRGRQVHELNIAARAAGLSWTPLAADISI
jgi:hypothetical protein